MWQRYFSQILQDTFEKAKETTPGLSLRSYARQLEVSPSVLSEILREQRKISSRRALEIAEKAQVEERVLLQLRKNMTPGRSDFRQILPSEAIDLVINPLYYRLLCALEILPIPARLNSIAAFLDVDVGTLQEIVEKLQLLSVVKVEDSQVYWLGRQVTTTEDVPNQKIQSFHKKTLQSAAADLELPVEEREYTSVTFAGNGDRILQAKNHIRSFRDTVSESMRDSKPDRIYELSIQLRPVSKPLSRDH